MGAGLAFQSSQGLPCRSGVPGAAGEHQAFPLRLGRLSELSQLGQLVPKLAQRALVARATARPPIQPPAGELTIAHQLGPLHPSERILGGRVSRETRPLASRPLRQVVLGHARLALLVQQTLQHIVPVDVGAVTDEIDGGLRPGTEQVLDVVATPRVEVGPLDLPVQPDILHLPVLREQKTSQLRLFSQPLKRRFASAQRLLFGQPPHQRKIRRPPVVLQRPQHRRPSRRMTVTGIPVGAGHPLVAQVLPCSRGRPHPVQLTPRSLHHAPKIPSRAVLCHPRGPPLRVSKAQVVRTPDGWSCCTSPARPAFRLVLVYARDRHCWLAGALMPVGTVDAAPGRWPWPGSHRRRSA